MKEKTQSDQERYPVVGRCSDIHEDGYGGYLRGIVFMRNGAFHPGVEQLANPDSLTAASLTFSDGPGFKTPAEAMEAAANKAHNVGEASKLQHESESGQPNEPGEPEIGSIKETTWITVDELDEIKGHVGRLVTEDEGDQYFAGIERSHRGGDSEIGWYGPYQCLAEAEDARDELIEEEQMPPEPEPAPSAPGMR